MKVALYVKRGAHYIDFEGGGGGGGGKKKKRRKNGNMDSVVESICYGISRTHFQKYIQTKSSSGKSIQIELNKAFKILMGTSPIEQESE